MHSQETQGRQGEVSAGEAHIRHAQRSHSSGHGVNDIGHIDTLLRHCAAKCFDVTGLQETKRDGTFEINITIECISVRLLKARISIKSNFVTFVVAYAPTEEAPEEQKAKCMAALSTAL